MRQSPHSKRQHVPIATQQASTCLPTRAVDRLPRAHSFHSRQAHAPAPSHLLRHPPRALLPNAQVFFHCDAAQAIGKIPVNVDAWNCDLMSISGHKIYGPKGIGALYVRRKPRVRIEPIMNGGGQERGLRSGTLAHPLVAGLGAACAIAAQEMGRDAEHIGRLSRKLRDGLLEKVPNIIINGDVEQRYQGNLNVSFSYVEGESLIMALKDIAVSSGSACTSDSLEPSYVLRALGVEEDMAHTSIRFGIGRFTTDKEVCGTSAHCVRSITRSRSSQVRGAGGGKRPLRALARHPRLCACGSPALAGDAAPVLAVPAPASLIPLPSFRLPGRTLNALSGGARDQNVREARRPAPTDEPPLGDGAGGRRPVQDPVVAALSPSPSDDRSQITLTDGSPIECVNALPGRHVARASACSQSFLFPETRQPACHAL